MDGQAAAKKRWFKRPLPLMAAGCGSVLLIVGLFLLVMFAIERFKDRAAPPPVDQPMIISIEDLHRAFRENQQAAEMKYIGKPLIVTGKIEYVHDISAPLRTNVLVGLFTGERIPAAARFTKQKTTIMALKEGQILAVRCEVEKFGPVPSSDVQDYLPDTNWVSRWTKSIPKFFFKVAPEMQLGEIVHLKNCELAQWEH